MQRPGHSKVIIDDVPDGEWQLYIKGDQFQKVAGAVRNATGAIKYATDVKMLHVAPAVAAYELGVERQLLIEASEEMGKTKLQVIPRIAFAVLGGESTPRLSGEFHRCGSFVVLSIRRLRWSGVDISVCLLPHQ